MIQLLATKYPRLIASILLLVFEGSLIPAYANRWDGDPYATAYQSFAERKNEDIGYRRPIPVGTNTSSELTKNEKPQEQAPLASIAAPDKGSIGGPTQPEMSSFKPAGVDNMVNLFTGDFNYNIPLMDVGGYPINLFYDGGIGMEQEASWVGLGWNINPGTVSRNMRGVPDDFNGEDLLKQSQKMKPNITWGARLGYDLELIGIKQFANFSGSVGASLGISVNNYLGPGLDLGIKGGTNFTVAGKSGSEKASASIGAGLSANLSSRSGLTLSPNMSLTAHSFANARGLSAGVSLGTSYNSRSGIKELQISEQMAYNVQTQNAAFNHYANKFSHVRLSTPITFARPSYIPALRMPITNEAYSGHFQLGNGLFGVYGSGEVEVYQQSAEVESADVDQSKPMVGYLYYQKAQNNPHAVMDFTRFNDNEVTPHTPIVSAPQYTYDVFTIQGEGTGGSIRAYRGDLGYVRDNFSTSKDKNLSIGADVGVPGHYGANFNTIQTPTHIGEWGHGNKLRSTVGFQEAAGTREHVYFRNPGETSVINGDAYAKIGGTDLVRYKLGGTNAVPTIEPRLEVFSKDNVVTSTTPALSSMVGERQKRTQVTSFLTAEEASHVGLDTEIKSYNTASVLDNANDLQFESIPRISETRKKHHISQIDVTEASGRRYVYGIPVYNLVQKDFSFSVDKTEILKDGTGTDRVEFSSEEASTGSGHVDKASKKDGFVQITETPPYAHAYLLSGLLSPDYVDVTGNGITEDDLGDAVKFNYTHTGDHEWRTPLSSEEMPIANFNAGNRSETKDDKGLVSYGKREAWYLHSIESKTMIALFSLEERKDGKGSATELKGINKSDQSQRRLKKIDLYSKADLKKNGLTAAKPIKTVWFAYSYALCAGAPGNNDAEEWIDGKDVNSAGGKLTLESIYFTFNGKERLSKNRYLFSYTKTDPETKVVTGNPDYAPNASDRWGTYKHASANLPGLKNSDHPYSSQDKTLADQNAGAWALKTIVLPSGGQIEVEYESDDYAYVQNRRAAAMLEIAGFGKDNASITNKLYRVTFDALGKPHFGENYYVFIKVPESCSSREEVKRKYLEGVDQFAFKMLVNMPKGQEYINAYATFVDYGRFDDYTIWVQLSPVKKMNPLALTALEYLRERLPGQAFTGYDVSESSGLKQIGEMLRGMLVGLESAFKDPVAYLRGELMAQTIEGAKSFVRLNVPDGYKYGGGHRVRSVKLKDNWQAMTEQYTSEYGQLYEYTTKEVFNGIERTISSGVASYEPSIGGEENPFQSIVQVVDKLPLGPASYGAIEMPMLDAFFPAPVVGYSKVTVRSLKRGDIPADMKSRSGVGKQVTEFYTAKDFPVYYNYTALDPTSDKQEHQASLFSFFYKYAFDSRALSQGFVVATNDMHGKLKSQASYAENDESTRINYTENFYRNTGQKGLEEKFDFVYAASSGVIKEGNMGIDVELMTDTREFSVKSSSLEMQGQSDWFPISAFPIWVPSLWPVSGTSENTYRAVTTTKVVNYHSVLDSVVVIDKGSQVSTKNLVYDAETGEVVVSRTNNEFDEPVYSVSYPAYWAYSGMGLAYKNIGARFSSVDFVDGQITGGLSPEEVKSVFESGDELYLIRKGEVPADNCGSKLVSEPADVLWALDRNKNNSSLTSRTPDLVFIDKKGKLYTRSGVSFKIIRSGKRNMLGATIAGVTTMSNPIITEGTGEKLIIPFNSNVVNATAVEYKEKWQTDNEVVQKLRTVVDPNTCLSSEVVDCNGYLEQSINPYRKGLLGNFRVYRSMVFYGQRKEADPLTATNLKQNGFLKEFDLYWKFNATNDLVPNVANGNWVWNSQVTRVGAKGMELETKNALDIYTAAHYGFHKTMPVAITNNARYDETASEGFEDVDYQESINQAGQNPCLQKHADFTGMANSQVVNTDGLNFDAHSGKYVLAVQANASASRIIPVRSGVVEDFALTMNDNTLKELSDVGGNLTKVLAQPASAPQIGPYYSTSNLGMALDFGAGNVTGAVSGNSIMYYFEYKTSQYTKITTPNTYSFTLTTHQDDEPLDPDQVYIYNKSNMKVTIKNLNGVQVASFTVNSTNSPQVQSVFLTCDTYVIETTCTVNIQKEKSTKYINDNGFHAFHADFGYTSNTGTTSYKSLYPQEACHFTDPIAAQETMLHPTFGVPAGKKMLFSAWVREACGEAASGVPCTKATYADNQVKLQFNDGVSQAAVLQPSGPIIEGWQRYEVAFTAPATATEATISFVNSSSQTIYFDDIRLHPFNANMKSYVYDPLSLRLTSELDANNYGTFYEYDEEGTLVRVKAETREGIKTLKETRSFKQQVVNAVQ